MIHDEKLKQHDTQPKKFHHLRKRVTEIIVYNFFWYVYVWRYNAPCWYKVNWFRMNIKLSACVLCVCVCNHHYHIAHEIEIILHITIFVCNLIIFFFFVLQIMWIIKHIWWNIYAKILECNMWKIVKKLHGLFCIFNYSYI